jgi:hypothetical protein
MTSVAFHLIVLTSFGAVKFSRLEAQEKQHPIPVAQVSQVKKFIQANPIIPKPKVKRPATDQFTKSTNNILPINQIFDTVRPTSQDKVTFARPHTNQSAFSLPNSEVLSPRVEFFGSFTDQRKVCYLVDCSGSMQGVFGQVRKKLKESIQGLQPDQYFYIIFFGGDKLFEFGNGRLLRAAQKAKSAANDFIDSVQPAGQTNALEALERAVQIRDSRGVSPSIIYFLTDGFELTTEDIQRFPQKIASLLRRFAPTTRINTIGFWPGSSDRKMLETIATQTGGECIFITEGDS